MAVFEPLWYSHCHPWEGQYLLSRKKINIVNILHTIINTFCEENGLLIIFPNEVRRKLLADPIRNSQTNLSLVAGSTVLVKCK